MKKRFLSLILVFFSFSFVLSCEKQNISSSNFNNSSSSFSSSSENTSTYNESSEMSSLSTSTDSYQGETKYIKAINSSREYPQIVKTKFSSEDTIVIDNNILDYDVDLEGKIDVSDKLQKAIDDVSALGGGTLYLPKGKYLITKQINIPMYVSIRGDFVVNSNNDEYGTLIIAQPECLSKDQLPEDKPLFNLEGNTGINGLTFYYKEQNLENKYGYTIYAKASITTTLKNIVFINSSYGIGISLHQQLNELINLENIYGTFLFNAIKHYGTSDVGYYHNINISSSYWANFSLFNVPKNEDISSFMEENLHAIILGDLDDQILSNINIDSCKIGIYFDEGIRKEAGFWGLIYNANIKGKIGVYAKTLNSQSGALFTSSTLGIINNEAKSGAIKLAGCEAIIQGEGNTFFEKDTKIENVKKKYEPQTNFLKTENLYVLENVDNSFNNDISSKLNQILKSIKMPAILYIPNGIYRLNEEVEIPSNIELRSSQGVFTRSNQSNDGKKGVTFISYVKGTTFSLKENSGIRGIRIVHALNDYLKAYDILKNNKVNNDTSIKAKGNNVYAYLIETVGAFIGFDFLNSENHVIKSCYGCSYKNFIKAGGENGRIEMCLANPNFFTRTNIFQYFDQNNQDVDISSWQKIFSSQEKNEDFQILRDDILRSYCTMINLLNADNEIIFNTFCYGEAGLILVENSNNVFAINTSLDFIYSDKPLYKLIGGSLIVISSLRVYGKSLELVEGNLKAYGRIGFNVLKEKAYDSSLNVEDVIDYVSDNAKHQVLFDCEKINNFQGVSLNQNKDYIYEGNANLKLINNNKNINAYQVFDDLDISSFKKGYLHLVIYCSDIKKIGIGQIEISSSKNCDNNELNWAFDQAVNKSYFNDIYLELESGSKTGGEIDFTKINYFRIYVLDTEAEYYLDKVEFVVD